jgi:predicted GTPase
MLAQIIHHQNKYLLLLLGKLDGVKYNKMMHIMEQQLKRMEPYLHGEEILME